MKRDEATRSLMRDENDNEAFLIRNHDAKRPDIRIGWFTLSWRRDDFVVHREIAATDNGKYIIACGEGHEYDTLFHIIEFYPWRFASSWPLNNKTHQMRLKIPALKVNTSFDDLAFNI